MSVKKLYKSAPPTIIVNGVVGGRKGVKLETNATFHIHLNFCHLLDMKIYPQKVAVLGQNYQKSDFGGLQFEMGESLR